MKTRDQKLSSSFITDGFEFKGIQFKPLTARTLILLEKLDSPFYKGGEDQLKGLLDLLFISSQETKTILKAINSDSFDEAVLDFADTFSPSDLTDLSAIVNSNNSDASAAIVEIRESGDSKKK